MISKRSVTPIDKVRRNQRRRAATVTRHGEDFEEEVKKLISKLIPNIDNAEVDLFEKELWEEFPFDMQELWEYIGI
jgi:hypothetical protein